MLALEITIVQLLKEAHLTNGVVKLQDAFEKLPEMQSSFEAVPSLHFIEVNDGTIRALTNQIFSETCEHVPCFVLVTLPTIDEDLVASFKWFVSSMH